MVPMLTCGLVRSNLAFATAVLLLGGWSYVFSSSVVWNGWSAASARNSRCSLAVRLRGPDGSAPGSLRSSRCSLAVRLRDDLLGDACRHLGVGVELHRVGRPALRLAAQVADVAEHLRERHQCSD